MTDTVTVTLWIILWTLPNGQAIYLSDRYVDPQACQQAAATIASTQAKSHATCIAQSTYQVPLPQEYERRRVPP